VRCSASASLVCLLALLAPNARDHLFGRSGEHWAMMVRRPTSTRSRPVFSTFMVLPYTETSCFQCLSHLPHETLVPTGATPGLPPILTNSSLYDDVVYVCVWVSLSVSTISHAVFVDIWMLRTGLSFFSLIIVRLRSPLPSASILQDAFCLGIDSTYTHGGPFEEQVWLYRAHDILGLDHR
jgi:hypothetical protein